MEEKKSIKSVLTKLVKIQSELKAPKGQENKFGHYKYRNCEDIMKAVKPLLNIQKAVLIVNDEIVLINGQGDDSTTTKTSTSTTKRTTSNNRFYVKATATIYCSETGESISTSAFARESTEKKGMDASQLTGSTSSYARKYALNGLLAIDDTKDSDSMDNKK